MTYKELLSEYYIKNQIAELEYFKKLKNNLLKYLLTTHLGLLGYIRLQVKEHTIIESHPDNEFQDLRLDNPFPELCEFMDSQHLENMSKNEYMHVPYVVILYKYLVEWKKNHEGKMPQTYKEKREFKEIIKKSMYYVSISFL